MEYKLIVMATPRELVDSVNESARNSWVPSGGVSVVWNPILQRTVYHQAMIRGEGYAEKNKISQDQKIEA